MSENLRTEIDGFNRCYAQLVKHASNIQRESERMIHEAKSMHRKLSSVRSTIPHIYTAKVIRIAAIVGERMGVTVDEMMGSTRPEHIAHARQTAMYIARVELDYSQIRIGDAFGGRDHGTVAWACRKVTDRIELDEEYAAIVESLRQKVREELCLKRPIIHVAA